MLRTKTIENKIVGVIENTDRLNATIAQDIKEELTDALIEGGYNLTLDLSNIRFIDSTGIGVLISALKTSRQNEGSFILKSVQKDVMSLLTLMKLDKVFDFV
ncbi:MAG TPA: STAS domain-containing protein [Marinilabiliaceae bacterium]|nr:STAS domain-containing protein [Marinilabiliaceae bacterium]